jgi:NADH-quinone oxidoreductase subunit C
MRIKELTPKYAALATAIETRFGAKVERLPTSTGELGYRVDALDLLDVCRGLRDTQALRFEMLMDLCAVDYRDYGRDEWQTASATGTGFSRGTLRGAQAEHAAVDDGDYAVAAYRPHARFAVVYHLLSITHNHRLRLKTFCPSDERPLVDSVHEVWAASDWFEREAFDLYGVLFKGHPDLRRLLTDYGFIGHPFRKDFPLIGNVEMRYDAERGRVVYEPVEIVPRTLVPRVIRDDARYEPELKDRDDA